MKDSTLTKDEWKPIATAPEGVTVLTKIDDGGGIRNAQPMKRQGWLWFAGSLYVYYQPTHWKPTGEVSR